MIGKRELIRLRHELVQRAIESEAPIIGRALHRWAEWNKVNWHQVAERLGLAPESLDMLAMCKPPSGERFDEELDQLVKFTGADRAVLSQILLASQLPSTQYSLAAEPQRPYDAEEKD